MRFPTTTICLILVVLLGSTAKAEIVLYCQSELATGFIKKNGSWKESNFALSRWTVKFSDDYKELSGLYSVGPPSKCSVPFSRKPNLVACVDAGGMFQFHKETMRFLFMRRTSGYVSNLPDPDTDVLYAGTCQNF